MEELFNQIQKFIAENNTELTLVDEDYGQLETSEDTYPVTFPCCLVSSPIIEWKDLSGLIQKGTYTLVIKIAIDCYDDTYVGSSSEAKTIERLEFTNKISKSLHRYQFAAAKGGTYRTYSRSYSIAKGIKVYESGYTINVED